MTNDLVNSLADLDEEKTLALVRQAVAGGATALDIVEMCRQGVEIVGRRYAEESYFLSDLIMSEEILRGVMQIIEPIFPRQGSGRGRKVVMGTIDGDIHDLGKNIVVYLLRSHGFEVYDLGVDVAPEAFLAKVRETGAAALGISVLLTYCVNSIRKVVKLLEEEGLRDRVAVVIGGYPVDDKVLAYTGADFFGRDAVDAVGIFQRITPAHRLPDPFSGT